MIALSADALHVEFAGEVLLENVTFSLNEGDKLGIVGVNGAGKSTLLKIFNSEFDNYTGNYYISKGKSIGMLSQYNDYEYSKTVYEEALAAFGDLEEREKQLEELSRRATNGDLAAANQYVTEYEHFVADGGTQFRKRCIGVLKSLGFDEDMQKLNCSKLSGGQKTRLALAIILLRSPDILMLDEPTNHLDIENIIWLERFLSNYKKTLIIISHDRSFLCATTNKTLEIENGKSKLYKGNYDSYITQKEKDREILLHQYKNQQKEIARIEAYIEQQRRWNRERNIIAAESREKQLAKMVKIEAPEKLPESARMTFAYGIESGNDVLTVRNLKKSFGDRLLFNDVSFLVKKSEKVIFTGQNGCGKSTLLKIICKKIPADRGYVDYGTNVSVGYYDQENQALNQENTVLDELWDEYDDMSMTDIRSTLALFLFKGDDVFKKVSVLSGGERAKLTLAKLMLKKVNLLVLDEPTNHLDIATREVLENALVNYPGTIVAVSHDRYFVKKIATRILYFDEHSIKSFNLGYEEYEAYIYKEDRSADASNVEVPVNVSSSKNDFEKSKKEKADKRRNEKRLAFLEGELKKAENRLVELEQKELEISTDHIALSALYEEKNALEENMLLYMEELEILSDILLSSN